LADTPTVKVHVIAMALAFAGCKVNDPLYCDEDRPCTDPDRPYCDLFGAHAASDGIARTCIADPFTGPSDAGPTLADAAVHDLDASPSADGGNACAWTQLVKLAGVNSSGTSEFVGSLNEAGTIVYFKRVGSEGTDGHYMATRVQGKAFGDAIPLEGLGDDDTYRTSPEVSSTGLEIIFGIAGGALVAATRGSAELPFEPAQEIGIEGGSPSLSGDGRSLYYVSQGDVFRTTRAEVGQPWGGGDRILPTTGFGSVDVSPDERRLLLIRPLDQSSIPLLVAERDSTATSFGAPMPLDESVLAEGGSVYSNAKWNSAGDEMIVSLLVDDEVDMFYAACQ
jgi:hypothetical protein